MWHQVDHPAIQVVPALGFAAVLGNSMFMCFGRAVFEAHHLFLDVTSPRGAMTSYVTSQLCTCTSHMIGCYKRLALLPWGTLSSRPLVHPSGSPLSPTYGWCLMHVGHDVSSASPGWSLLPSSIIIVLALVNSAMFPGGPRYLNKTQECRPTPFQYHFHRTAVPFSWCPCASW